MPHNNISALSVWFLIMSPMSVVHAAEVLPEESSSVIPAIIIAVVIVAIGLLLVVGLTQWGRKQDEINSMMYFCIDFLINTRNKAERYRAAKELGRAKNPGALLVLVDVINDESAEEGIRKAAHDALLDMSENYSRYKKVIGRLLIAAEVSDHERVVDLLKANFEQDERKYVQSAYVIGRELVRLQEYAEAREWMRIADTRNKKFPLYVDQIREYIDLCNQHLFAEGDMAFEAEDFHLANERFALAAYGLSTEVSNQFSYYLRAACVYCKLEDYENAGQALLQALHHQEEETDTALELNTRVNKVQDLVRDKPGAKEEHTQLIQELDRFVNQIMEQLSGVNRSDPS